MSPGSSHNAQPPHPKPHDHPFQIPSLTFEECKTWLHSLKPQRVGAPRVSPAPPLPRHGDIPAAAHHQWHTLPDGTEVWHANRLWKWTLAHVSRQELIFSLYKEDEPKAITSIHRVSKISTARSLKRRNLHGLGLALRGVPLTLRPGCTL